MRIRLKMDDYAGVFQKKAKSGRFRTVYKCGNSQQATEIAGLLAKLGHRVETVDTRTDEEDTPFK